MLFKNFTVFRITEGLPIIRDRLMGDDFDATMAFAGAIPEDIEYDQEAKCSTGFDVPGEDIQIDIACSKGVPMNQRLYRMIHINREKQIDPEGIRDRCQTELPELGNIEMQDEIDRRIAAAMAIAPIKESSTHMMVRGDGTIVVGAALNQAERVVRDFLYLFTQVGDDEEQMKTEGRYDHDRRLFKTSAFNNECARIVSRDVWHMDDGMAYVGGEPAVQFNGDFAVKLKDKAKLTVAKVSELPDSLWRFIEGAEYASIALTVTTDSGKYKLKLTPNGEVKGCCAIDPDDDDDEFESNDRWVMGEMLAVYSRLKGQFAQQPEEE